MYSQVDTCVLCVEVIMCVKVCTCLLMSVEAKDQPWVSFTMHFVVVLFVILLFCFTCILSYIRKCWWPVSCIDSPLFCLHTSVITSICHHARLFYVSAWDWTQVLILPVTAFYQLSDLPRPNSSIFITCNNYLRRWCKGQHQHSLFK